MACSISQAGSSFAYFGLMCLLLHVVFTMIIVVVAMHHPTQDKSRNDEKIWTLSSRVIRVLYLFEVDVAPPAMFWKARVIGL